jgi:hypothetical protein
MLKKICTRQRGKFKIKIGFIVSKLTKYLNNTPSINLVEVDIKKEFVYMQKSSQLSSCVY